MEQVRWEALYDEIIGFVNDAVTALPFERRASRAMGVLFAIYCHAVSLTKCAASVVVAAEICEIAGVPSVITLERDPSAAMLEQFRRHVAVRRAMFHPRELTTDEAADALGCTPQHVRRLARAGHIEARRGPTGAWLCAPTVLNYQGRRFR